MHSKKRTVMIFPEFNNINYIDELREKYDSLSDKVRPHITLIFPFESSLDKTKIFEILYNRLHKIKPFEISVQGLSVMNRWLVLNVTNGANILTEIHTILYANEFLSYKPAWLGNYVPHITVGAFDSSEEAANVYEKERYFNNIFNCVIDKISVEIIGKNEQSIIEIEYLLDRI